MATVGDESHDINGKTVPHVRIPNDFIVERMAEIGVYGFAVLSALLVHTRGIFGGVCYPSIDLLQTITGLSKRGVLAQIDRLEFLGIIRVARSDGRKPNIYSVSVNGAPGAPLIPANGAPHDTQRCAPRHANGALGASSIRSIPNETAFETPQSETGAAWLAREWLHYRKGGRSNFDQKAADNFEELLAAGVSAEAITAEIKRPGRQRTEAIWDFCKRMLPPKGKNGKHQLSGSEAFLNS